MGSHIDQTLRHVAHQVGIESALTLWGQTTEVRAGEACVSGNQKPWEFGTARDRTWCLGRLIRWQAVLRTSF